MNKMSKREFILMITVAIMTFIIIAAGVAVVVMASRIDKAF
jgi:hypothetical protein